VTEHLSEEALFWGCKIIDGRWATGTDFATAGAAISGTGQPENAAWPYEMTRVLGVPYDPPLPPSDLWHTSRLESIPADVNSVRTELSLGRPVVLGVILVDTFYQPVRGRIGVPPEGSPTRGGHALLAVGHDASGLMIRNSWGASWGSDGYAWLSEEYVDRYLIEAWLVRGPE
jgi:hypothetical protein